MRHIPLPLVLLLAPAAAAQSVPTVVFSEVAGDPTSIIPGTTGAEFETFTSIHQSPNGEHWTLHARSTSSSSFDNHFLVDGDLFLREFFDTLPWNSSSGWVGGQSDILDDGRMVLRAEGTGSVTDLVTYDPTGSGSWSVLLQKNDSIAQVPGGTWFSFIQPRMTSDGRVAFVGDVSGASSGASEALWLDGALPLVADVTTLNGAQNGSTLLSLSGTLDVNAQGTKTACQGFNTAGDILVIDDTVVLERNQPIAGLGSTRGIQRISGHSMGGDGSVYAWGLQANDGWDWVWREGQILAEEFQPIVPGSSEQWRQSLTLLPAFSHAFGNANGDYVVVGLTTAANGQVMVLNGSEVVLRNGDPVDLDGNGLLDDDCFLGSIQQVAGWGANGVVRFVGSLSNGAGSGLGDAVLAIEIGGGGGLGTTYCHSNANSTGAEATLELLGTASVAADDLALLTTGLPAHQFGIYVCSETQGFVAGPGGSQGNLCLGGAIGRQVGGLILNSSAAGVMGTRARLGFLPTPTQHVAGQPGETWNFQLWFRDTGGNSNYSSAVSVTLE